MMIRKLYPIFLSCQTQRDVNELLRVVELHSGTAIFVANAADDGRMLYEVFVDSKAKLSAIEKEFGHKG